MQEKIASVHKLYDFSAFTTSQLKSSKLDTALKEINILDFLTSSTRKKKVYRCCRGKSSYEDFFSEFKIFVLL